MIDILVALAIWYGLGAVAAAWATRRGHVDLWLIGAALWGAIMLPLVIAARLAVLARPARPPMPARITTQGAHALLVVDVEDSPRQALAPIAGMAMQLAVVDVIVLVSEEARSGIVASSELAEADELVHRILRNVPAVETTTVITSLSALEQLARRGWQADLVGVSEGVRSRPTGRAVLRSVAKLDRHRPQALRTRPPRRAAHRRVRSTQRPNRTESVDAV